jgi:nucleoside-diphosphate-sugar epimerase
MIYDNLVITGATSYLGKAFLNKYYASFKNIFAIIRPSTNFEILKSIPNIQFIQWDKDVSELKKVNFDIMLHLATCYGRKNETPEEIFKANVTFPEEILKELKSNIKLWINIDTSLPSEVNHYALSKFNFLEILKKAPRFNILNLKLQQLYGPNDGTFINFLIDSIIKKVPSIDMTKGTQLRDFIYIEDAVSAIFAGLKSFSFEDKQQHLFKQIDIGSGRAHSIREVVEVLQKISNNHETQFHWGKKSERTNEPQKLVASPEALQSLGWSAQVDLELGLNLTYKKMITK